MWKSSLRFLLITLALGFLLTIALIAALPFAVPQENIKQFLADAFRQRTGKELTINGKASFGLFPELSFTLEDLTVADPASPGAPPVRVESIRLGVNARLLLKDALSVSALIKTARGALALSLESPSLRGLSGGAPTPLTLEISEPAPLLISLVGAREAKRVSLRDIVIKLGDAGGKGSLDIDRSGRIPAVKGAFTFGLLDADRLAQAAAPALQIFSTGKREQAAAEGARAALWSQEKLDFSGLSRFSADISLAAEGVRAGGLTLGKTSAAIGVRDARLSVKLLESALYGGNGEGALALDGGGALPALAGNLTVHGVRLGGMLRDMTGRDWLEASGDADISISAGGHSQWDMISALRGDGRFLVRDGVIKGVDLMALATASAGDVGQQTAAGDTKIMEASASFTAEQGVIRNGDLLMKMPFSQVTGKGALDLKDLSVNYRILPEATGPNAGIKIPLLITGPLTRPQVTVDVAGAALQGIGTILKDNPAAQIIKEGAGAAQDAAKEIMTPENMEKGKQLLKGIFEGR